MIGDLDYEILAKVCKGLSHPTRWKIYEILEKHGGESKKMEIVEIINILRSDYDFNQDYVRVKYHIEAMEDAGIVKIIGHEKRNDECELLVGVKIDVKQLKQ
jgi:DNA-binding transcriptional ArsR family regulator